jgi:hypothetical protein
MVPSSCWTFVVRGLESIRLGRAKASIGLRGIDCSTLETLVTISQKLVGKGDSWDSSNHLGEMNIMYRDVLPVCNEERMSKDKMHAVYKGALLHWEIYQKREYANFN